MEELRRQWEEDVKKGEDYSGDNTPALRPPRPSVIRYGVANYYSVRVRRQKEDDDLLALSMSHAPRGHSFPEKRGI